MENTFTYNRNYYDRNKKGVEDEAGAIMEILYGYSTAAKQTMKYIFKLRKD